MSTPAQERAGVLAESTFNALTAARTSLRFAAETADETDLVLRRGEDELAELGGQANRIRYAGDDPRQTQEEVAGDVRRHFRNAQELGEDVDRRLRAGGTGLQETRDHLEQSARAIAAGRQFIDELEQMPDQRGPQTEELRDRLVNLDRAVRGAMDGVEQTEGRLRSARRNLEPMLQSYGHNGDPARTAAEVSEAASSVDRDVTQARSGIRTLREDFENARPNADLAALRSDELATAFRAGTNPTPRSQQSAPAAEDPRRAWSEGRDLGSDLNR